LKSKSRRPGSLDREGPVEEAGASGAENQSLLMSFREPSHGNHFFLLHNEEFFVFSCAGAPLARIAKQTTQWGRGVRKFGVIVKLVASSVQMF
jgi:hypothetical protein